MRLPQKLGQLFDPIHCIVHEYKNCPHPRRPGGHQEKSAMGSGQAAQGNRPL
jgi:hypothetical protein